MLTWFPPEKDILAFHVGTSKVGMLPLYSKANRKSTKDIIKLGQEKKFGGVDRYQTSNYVGSDSYIVKIALHVRLEFLIWK